MAHRTVRNIALIKDLCDRLGFSYDSEQLEHEGGLDSLLPQIQERLNQLRDEDTYGNVEEIPTDSCPIVFAEPQSELPENTMEAALQSIVQSMVSTQLRLILVAHAIASGDASNLESAADCRDTAWTVVWDSFCPLLAEIRSELLLREVLLSVMRIATDAIIPAGSGGSCYSSCTRSCCCCGSERCSISRPAWSSSNAFCATPASNSGKESLPNSATHSPTVSASASRQTRRATSRSSAAISSTGSKASMNSHGSDSFRGFPCYPSPRPSTANSNEATSSAAAGTNSGGYGQAQVWDAAVDDARSRPKLESRVVTIGRKSPRRSGQLMEEFSASWIGCANSSNDSTNKSQEAGHGSQRHQKTEGEIMSFSNMEARWRGSTVVERRRDFYWPIPDAYMYPYDDADAVARDRWQFIVNRKTLCPAYARFNRLRRDEMRSQRKRNPQRDNLIVEGGASSPLELYNGVLHPLGPSGAPCRAAFIGD